MLAYCMGFPNDYYLTITEENKQGREYRDHTYDVNGVSCSSCSKFFATCSKDNTIKIYLFVENKILNTLYEPQPINAIKFLTIKNLQLASAGDEGVIKIWSIKAGKVEQQLPGHTQPVWEIEITKDDQYLISGGFDKLIKVWDLDRSQLIRNFTIGGRINTILSHQDNLNFFSLANDQKVNKWSISKGVKLFEQNSNHVIDQSTSALDFTPCGKYLGVACKLGKVVLYFVSNLEIYETISFLSSDDLNIIKFSLNTIQMIIGDDNGFKVWNRQNLSQPDQSITFRNSWLNRIAVSQDEMFIYFSCNDGAMRRIRFKQKQPAYSLCGKRYI